MSGGRALPFRLEPELLDIIFPFWFAFGKEMEFLAGGPSLRKLLPGLEPGRPLSFSLALVRPKLAWNFEDWTRAGNRLFVLKGTPQGAMLRGQILHQAGDPSGVVVCTLWLTKAEELESLGLTLLDLELANPVVDLLHLFQAERIAAEENRTLALQLESRGRALDDLNRKLVAQNAFLREVERDLRETTQREQAILMSAQEAIVTIDEAGTVVSCNPATELMFGFSASELVGENVAKLMPPPFAEQHDGYIRAYLETGRGRVIGRAREVLAQRKDGSVFPIELSIGEVRHSDRRLFTGIVRDITQRKTAEAEARQSLAELESSRENLKAALNQMRVGTVVVDQDHRVLFLNDACPIGVGLDRGRLAGSFWFDALPLDQASRERVHALLRQPESERTREPLQCSAEGGRRYHLEGDVRDFPGDAGRRIIYLYDISELHDLKRQLSRVHHGTMVGGSSAMRELYREIGEVSAGDWTVLIEGETGSGKELVARSIHAASGRSEGPFIAVNCAGLTDSLLASQLFGHIRGAFTGAVSNQEGVFEAASGGTLFLDEIGDIPPATQSALLRVLQEKEIVRVGEVKPRKVNVRILAATHRDLAREVAEGRFRQDLLFRIRVARVRVPPLRERIDDVPLLAAAFLAECRVSSGVPIAAITTQAMTLLETYPWPGNVRELKSSIESAAIRCKSGVIQPRDLPVEIQGAGGSRFAAPRSATGDERSRILEAIRACGGHRGKAAALLGMSRATFYRKIAALGLDSKSDAGS